jgi:Mg2+-importing ATPase
VPAIAIAGDNVDREYLKRPHRWNVTFIRNFVVVFGLVSSIFDFLTFGLLLFVIRAGEAEFRTGWFIESLLTELLVALVVRTRRPFYRSRPGRWLWISALAVAVLTIALPYLPDVQVLGFVPLSFELTALIIGITLAYVLAAETVKSAFYNRFTDVT